MNIEKMKSMAIDSILFDVEFLSSRYRYYLLEDNEYSAIRVLKNGVFAKVELVEDMELMDWEQYKYIYKLWEFIDKHFSPKVPHDYKVEEYIEYIEKEMQDMIDKIK